MGDSRGRRKDRDCSTGRSYRQPGRRQPPPTRRRTMTNPTTMSPARAILGGVSAGGAVALALVTQAGTTKRMDRAVRRMVKPKRGPRVVKLAKGISYLASPAMHPWMAIAATVAI